MHVHQNSIILRATPQDVWSQWVQPALWSSWDPEIQTASSDQSLRLGSTGSLTTQRGSTHAFRVVLCDPSCSFMLSYQHGIGVEINIKRSWERVPEGVRVTQEVNLIGPMAALAARMRKDHFVQMIDRSLQGLKSKLEGPEVVVPQGAPSFS
ncbi:hypothetical protein [Deinococcus cellulosilyticus]|uniref:Polyketide cyclase n=1 Tax=Deinococcus cellulosilyticus (strain DSM 18568 / NBRC 106333 / KACC 11606 / 5516J-15) TaxID=1223518 RepID=A0A511MZL0_DEIC1|nr:hypothetical protein [Deinococcus cellulosilyticus]GEM45617.1 hypothetical protein DC3_12520 [Deinococcus cellulosilyticus NBRC 106333 = KACC 11606]